MLLQREGVSVIEIINRTECELVVAWGSLAPGTGGGALDR
jgi:hypothetical protein